jgi:hypothetical protein
MPTHLNSKYYLSSNAFRTPNKDVSSHDFTQVLYSIKSDPNSLSSISFSFFL